MELKFLITYWLYGQVVIEEVLVLPENCQVLAYWEVRENV